MYKIYEIVRDVILVISVAAVLFLGLLINVCNVHPLVVVSGSMEPEIMTGSLCFINYDDRNVDIGDVVAYESGDITVMHRVIDKTVDGYITKGDNNDTEDLAPVPQKHILGTEILNIPRLGYIIMSLRTPSGLITTITVVVAFIAIGIVLKLYYRMI